MRARFSQLLDRCTRRSACSAAACAAGGARRLRPLRARARADPRPARRGQFYTECYALYPYEGVVAESLRRFKFSGQSQYAASFGRMLAPLLRTAPFEILSWVPVSAKRRQAPAGYDQTELLAPRRGEGSGASLHADAAENSPQSPRSRPSGRRRAARQCAQGCLPAPFLPNALRTRVLLSMIF